MRRTVILTVIVGLLAASPAMAQKAKAKAEIPVSRVVLFSSGVGYFEHTGAVEGDASTQLMFKTDQINDILKSMVLMDLDGGTVNSVNYASRDPLVRALRSFAIDLSGDPKMADLLKQLRGAEVEIAAPDKITGKILSIETVKKQLVVQGTPAIIQETVLHLVTAGGIGSFNMNAVGSLKLTDENLSAEMNKALELLIASHDTQKKPVEIRFSGRGRRRVRIGYIVETPIWKTSYRLDLSGEKPLLQGWAIVENTSDNDWSKVNLSLVSGRPISFIQDLYTPLYMPRPVVKPELYASLRPQEYDEGIETEKKAEALARNATRRGYLAAAPAAKAQDGQALRGRYSGGPAGGELALNAGVQSIASAGKVGELFNFTIKDPVDLPRRKSAMLPIINANITAEKVSIYNAAVLAKHPLNGAQLVNDTDMKLMGGPITVLDDGMYAGDARIDNLAEKDKRLISYAIDLNVTVDPSEKTDARITAAKIVNGVLHLQRLQTYQQTYKIKNKADEKRAIIVEHPYRGAQRKLIEPEKPLEKTPTLYRFRLDVAKDATTDFVVKEQQIDRETIAIAGQSTRSLLWYTKTGEISEKVRDAIAKAIRLKNELSTLEAQLGELTAKRKTLESDQARQRENYKTVGKDMGQRYLKKLSDLEDQIEKLDADIAALRKKITDKKKELADYLNKLNVE
ncbi:MAG TPA: hypothetical protein VNA25_08050 [Phycisphaerae bacterium]|nr:hypothetical protein [Phycisphaerae bacterium]